jgi:phospholipase/carboxylesterase
MTLHFSPDFWLSRAGLLHGNMNPPPMARTGWSDGPAADGDAAPSISVLDDAGARVESLESPGGEPAAVFVPERYEPNYAYPLLVWLHNGAADRRDLQGLMSRVSTRNMLAVTVACPELPAPLSPGAMAATLDEISGTLRRVRARYHVHTERVYPIGFAAGGSLALALLLERPGVFGGAISLCGRLPKSKRPLFRFRELNRKPVLLAAGAKDECVPVTDVVRTGRLLHSAGMSVSTRVYDAAQEMTPRMLRDVDCWVLGEIGAVMA